MKEFDYILTVSNLIKMGVKKLFTGLCRKGFAYLPNKISSTRRSALEASEIVHVKGTTDCDELDYPNDEKTLITSDLQGQKRLRIVSIIGLLLSLLTVFLTLNDTFDGADSPQCRSIYMFPSYARIDGFDQRFTPLAQKYHLYLYREQGKDRIPYQDGNVHLDGLPVLFIPGNAGSYKQVRSIAAASSNLYFDDTQDIENEHAQNLDFFAADFNEDFTAFHGRTMLDQAEYLNDAIRYILSLYAENDDYPHSTPTSVIVVAHSMGGIVARILPTLQNHVAGSVRTILTLSSPHAAAPVTFDGDILKIYQRTNDYWREEMSDAASFLSQNVSLISITGGILDLMLPADYTAVEDIVPLENGFTTYTTGVPGVWTPIDHLAIVWCDQLRTKIAKSLLEIVDKRVGEKVLPLSSRMAVFRRMFLSGLEETNSSHLVTANFIENSEDYHSQEETATLKDDEHLVIKKSDVETSPRFSRFILSSEQTNSHFSFLTSLHSPSVFFCKEFHSEPKCVLASAGLLEIPASFKQLKYPAQSSSGSEVDPFKLLSVNSETLSHYDSILIETPPEMSEKDFISSTLHAATSIEFDESPLHLALFGKTIELTEQTQLITLRFPKIWDSLLSYRIHCSSNPKTESTPLFEPFIRQWIVDPLETKWHINVGSAEIDINMHNVAPFIPLEERHDKSLKLDVFLPPQVGLKLKMEINWKLTLKMLFIRYRLTFLSFPFAIASFVMAHQFLWYRETGTFISFNSALATILQKYGLLMTLGLSLLSPIVNYKPVQRVLFMLDPVGLNRPFQLEQQHMHTNFYFLGIRDWSASGFGVFFGIMSVGLLFLIAQTFDFIDRTISKVKARDTPQTSKRSVSSERVPLMDRKRFATCLLLICAVNLYIPYQLACAICLLIQIGICVKRAWASSSKRLKDEENLRNYNFAILLLLLFIVAIDAPTIIVFLHNVAIKWETPFRSHHNVMAIAPIIFLVSANSTSKIVPSRSKSALDGPVTVLLLGYASFFSLVYGSRNLFWIHHLINMTCAWLFFTMWAGPPIGK